MRRQPGQRPEKQRFMAAKCAWRSGSAIRPVGQPQVVLHRGQ